MQGWSLTVSIPSKEEIQYKKVWQAHSPNVFKLRRYNLGIVGGEIGHLEMKLSQMIEHFHDPTTTVGGLAITGYLYRLARRRGIPPIDAEDIPQDLLMTFMKRLHDGKDSDIPQVGTFLSRSLDNKIIDHKRATLGRDGRKARPTHEISEAIFLSDTSLGPVQTAIMHEYGERINAAMHNLRTNHINLSDLAFERVFRGVSPSRVPKAMRKFASKVRRISGEERKVFDLWLTGISYEEIAAKTEKGLDTVAALVNHARGRIDDDMCLQRSMSAMESMVKFHHYEISYEVLGEMQKAARGYRSLFLEWSHELGAVPHSINVTNTAFQKQYLELSLRSRKFYHLLKLITDNDSKIFPGKFDSARTKMIEHLTSVEHFVNDLSLTTDLRVSLDEYLETEDLQLDAPMQVIVHKLRVSAIQAHRDAYEKHPMAAARETRKGQKGTIADRYFGVRLGVLLDDVREQKGWDWEQFVRQLRYVDLDAACQYYLREVFDGGVRDMVCFALPDVLLPEQEHDRLMSGGACQRIAFGHMEGMLFEHYEITDKVFECLPTSLGKRAIATSSSRSKGAGSIRKLNSPFYSSIQLNDRHRQIVAMLVRITDNDSTLFPSHASTGSQHLGEHVSMAEEMLTRVTLSKSQKTALEWHLDGRPEIENPEAYAIEYGIACRKLRVEVIREFGAIFEENAPDLKDEEGGVPLTDRFYRLRLAKHLRDFKNKKSCTWDEFAVQVTQKSLSTLLERELREVFDNSLYALVDFACPGKTKEWQYRTNGRFQGQQGRRRALEAMDHALSQKATYFFTKQDARDLHVFTDNRPMGGILGGFQEANKEYALRCFGRLARPGDSQQYLTNRKLLCLLFGVRGSVGPLATTLTDDEIHDINRSDLYKSAGLGPQESAIWEQRLKIWDFKDFDLGDAALASQTGLRSTNLREQLKQTRPKLAAAIADQYHE